MESHGSFHGIYSWNLQLMEATEASFSTDTGIFHVLPPLTSMEVNLLPSTPMQASTELMEVAIDGIRGSFPFYLPWRLPCISMEAAINFHGRKNLLPPTSIDCSIEVNLLPPNSMDVSTEVIGDFRGSRLTK